jgi:hypothetical protein
MGKGGYICLLHQKQTGTMKIQSISLKERERSKGDLSKTACHEVHCLFVIYHVFVKETNFTDLSTGKRPIL